MDNLQIFKKIVMIREFERKLDFLFKQGLVKGTAHFCIGQEYIPAIISQYLTDSDYATSTHRGHGHAIAKGLEIKKLMAEILGKKEGYNSGKGGSQHISSEKQSFIANGVSGGMVPVATGLAFSNKYSKNGNITVAYFGDGAFNEGAVQEALNIAKIYSLPILFVCENNQYAMSTPMKTSHAAPITRRVEGYGIKCETIQENDYEKLDEAARKFITEMRSIPEPRFIEVQTYRHLGHSKNDKNLYRSKEEEKYWFERDAYAKIRQKLGMKEEEIAGIEDSIINEINKAAEEAIAMPGNNPEDMYKGVLA